MSRKIDVRISTRFSRYLERLARKYFGVLDEVERLVHQLMEGELPGDKIPRTRLNVYKVRLVNPAAGRGKSGGFRVIYFVRRGDFIILITIYSKSEQEDISVDEIRRLVDEALNEIGE